MRCAASLVFLCWRSGRRLISTPEAPARPRPGCRRRGLEWLYRLMQEPRRLWRRYLFLNPAYLALVALAGHRSSNASRRPGRKMPLEPVRPG